MGKSIKGSQDVSQEEKEIDAALRPHSLGEFIGQERVQKQLDLVLRAAKSRGAVPTLGAHTADVAQW